MHILFQVWCRSKKPSYALSAAMERLYDQWNPHEDLNNELYSNFKYTPLNGFKNTPFTSRRDPTKVIKMVINIMFGIQEEHLHVTPLD